VVQFEIFSFYFYPYSHKPRSPNLLIPCLADNSTPSSQATPIATVGCELATSGFWFARSVHPHTYLNPQMEPPPKIARMEEYGAPHQEPSHEGPHHHPRGCASNRWRREEQRLEEAHLLQSLVHI